MKMHITETGLKDVTVPEGKPYVLVHDQEQKGFAVQVTARGVMSYVLIYRDANNKQRQTKLADVGPVSAQAARSMAREMLQTIAKGRTETAVRKPRAALSPVMDDFFFNTYLPTVEAANKSPGTNESIYRNHVQPVFGRRRMADLDGSDMREFYAALKEKPVGCGRWKSKSSETLKESTAKRIMILVRHMYHLAIADKKNAVAEDPTKSIPLRLGRNIKGKFLNKAQLQALVQAAMDSDNEHLAAIVQVLAGTGLRRNNVLSMRWEWVNLEEGSLTVPAEFDKAGLGFKLFLSDGVLHLLKQRRAEVKEGIWVFPNPKTGKPFHSCRAAWVTACNKAGLPGLRVHDLRHTMASTMLDIGADILDVQKQLGHTQIKTTVIYLHLREQRRREKANMAEQASGIFM